MDPEKLFIKRFSELIDKGNYTLEDIGYAIGIKSKSTISKYMSGDIKNIKRSTIVKLANFFNVSPAWLVGFSDDKYEGTNIPFSKRFNEEIIQEYGPSAIEHLENYNKLNELGKQTADVYVESLTEVPKYTEKKQNYKTNG